jgi:hypothetical protein
VLSVCPRDEHAVHVHGWTQVERVDQPVRLGKQRGLQPEQTARGWQYNPLQILQVVVNPLYGSARRPFTYTTSSDEPATDAISSHEPFSYATSSNEPPRNVASTIEPPTDTVSYVQSYTETTSPNNPYKYLYIQVSMKPL